MARKKKMYQSIAPQELNRWLEEGREMVVIDSLPSEQFGRNHIPGAVNVCVFEVVFLDEIRRLIPDRRHTVVVYGECWETFEAAAAAEKLVRGGYGQVFTLEGGICAWNEAGFAVDGQEGAARLDSASQFTIPRTDYIVDTQASTVGWTGRNANSSHTGSLKLCSGRLTCRQGRFTGSFEADMGSIVNHDIQDMALRRVLVEHLLSDDFFFVRSFPRAVFSLSSASCRKKVSPGQPNFEVKGRLQVREITAELHFPATVSNLAGGEIAAQAHFDLDRTRWGVIYGSGKFFRYLGMHLVYDIVSIDVRILARRP